jgi:2-polyprenyl-3-methyl-5-hydroxy-6-metoxy-1,4-benzoquinol methylase
MPIRLHKENINTPEYYNEQWSKDDIWNHFDTVRMQALCKHIKKNDAICELGAGLFGFAEFAAHEKLCNDISVVDFSPLALNKIKDKYPSIVTYKCDITNLYEMDKLLLNNAYDLVGAGEVIEHMERPEDLAQEMSRICKPGGWIIISSVNPDCEDAKKLEYWEHLWKFSIEELLNYFAPYGETKHSFIGNYHLVECNKW